ncbi:MAG: Gfo/Idh/MocA family oxidoreductase [Planctomycetia bacterium]|nr:Gfo/Idh/MocA family oxidoreductase [Planctomycetia bacterium]
MKRRSFLKTAAGGAILPALIPGSALGLDHHYAASERTVIGMIGLGFLGRVHLFGLLNNPKVQVIALSDVDRWRLDDAARMAEEEYHKQGLPAFGKAVHKDHEFRDLLARSEIDGVVLTMGDRWHSTATIMAAEAGKDVFVEKPVSLYLKETEEMETAVRRTRRITQVGIQQRSDIAYQHVCRFLRDGRIGKITNIYITGSSFSVPMDLPAQPVPPTLDWDRWLGPAPWRPFNSRFHQLGLPRGVVPWSFCSDFGNGSIADSAVHSFDIINWSLGLKNFAPLEITPPGEKYPWLTYRFPNDVFVQVVKNRLDSTVLNFPKGWNPDTNIMPFGGVFVGTNGWIHVGRMGFLTASSPDLIADAPAYYTNRPDAHNVPFVKRGKHYWTAFYDHKDNWIDGIRNRTETAAPVRIGCEATRCSILGAMACRLKRELIWDPDKQEFKNDEEANRLRSRANRAPWNRG